MGPHFSPLFAPSAAKIVSSKRKVCHIPSDTGLYEGVFLSGARCVKADHAVSGLRLTMRFDGLVKSTEFSGLP